MSARKLISVLLAGSLGAGSLAGCSMEPKYVQPDASVPQSWPVGDAYLRQSEATLPGYAWRDAFADPRLVQLIQTALDHNQDVALAVANIAAARASYQVQRASLFPEIDTTRTFTHHDNGSLSSSPGAGNAYELQGGVSGYELDLFGRLRSLTGAARSRYLGSEAAARSARLTLVAEVAQAWVTYANDASLLATAQETAAAAADSAKLTRRRLDGGIAARTDLRQAEIIQRTAEADVASQTTALAQDANALRLLLGAEPDAALLPKGVEDLAGAVREVPAGLDSGILLRRPDVVEAEYDLRAANAEIGAARAALFPRISLTGLLGVASDALSSLFTGGAFSWSAGASATYSIFSGGSAKANVRLSQAQRDAALASYRKAIQTAFSEVADALARRGTIDAQVTANDSGQAAATDNLALVEMRYKGGIDSYLEELTARQSLYSAQKSAINTRAEKAANLIELYRVLGGDATLGEPAR